MKRLIPRSFALFVVIVFVSSSIAIMPAHAIDWPTSATVSATPNPAIAYTSVQISGRITPDPPFMNGTIPAYHSVTIRVTEPDGSWMVFGPYDTDTSGRVQLSYTPSDFGTFSVLLNYPGEVQYGIWTCSPCSASTSFNVPLPQVTVSPSSAALTEGGPSQLFTSTVSHMTPPYSYQWILDSIPVSSASTYTYPPGSAGSRVLQLIVTDPNGLVATCSVPITVNPPPVVSISPSSATLDVGMSQTFTSVVSGGTPPYSYQWFLDSGMVGAAYLWTYTPSSAGSHQVTLGIWDSAGVYKLSSPISVTVNEALGVSISPSLVTMDVGQSQLYASVVSGGTLPYSYQWYLSGNPVSGANGATWTYTPSSAGSHTVQLKITDSLGAITFSNTASVTVNSVSFMISPSAGAGGSISPSTPQTVSYGGSQTFTITANTGYHIADVVVDGSTHLGAVTSYTFTDVQASHTIAASFTLNEYTVTVTVYGSGTVNRDINGPYHYNDVVTLTASPATGWSFNSATGWSGAGTTDGSGRRVVTVTGNMAVSATFTQIEYTLSITVVGGGSVSKTPNQATYHYGDSVRLTATANTGWTFSGWSGDISGTTSPMNVTIDTNPQVTATFTQIEYTLSITISGGGSVTKSPSQATYHYGDVVQLTALANAGWAFKQWSGDLTGQANPKSVTIDTNPAVTATFAQYVAPPVGVTYGGANNDEASAIVKTSDGGYAIAGYTLSFVGDSTYKDFYLIRTDSAGTMLWNKTYGGSGEDIAHELVQTGDGGFAIIGETNSFGAGGVDAWLVRTDADGNMLWNETYGGTANDWAYDIVLLSDGGFAIAGKTGSFGATGTDFWLFRTDASGTVQWNRIYNRVGNEQQDAYALVQTSDGGFALTGETNLGQYIWLVRTNSSGGMLWSQTYGGSGYDHARDIVQTSDGGIAISGWTQTGSYDAWIIRTNASGSVLWNKIYGGTGTNYESLYGMVLLGDGGFALAGSTYSYGAGTSDYWLVRTDASGNKLWHQAYGGTTMDVAFDLVLTGDGGYALAGYTTSFGYPTSRDAWLVFAQPPTYSLSVTVSPSAGGSVTKSPDSSSYELGSAVQLTAVPAAGWTFAGWSGDLSGTTNPATVTIDANPQVTATFIQNEYTLTVNTVGSGTVGKSPDQATYHYGDVVTLAASAGLGWSFTGWSGDLSGLTNPASLTIDTNPAVTATFTQITYVISPSAGIGGSISPSTPQTVNYGDSSPTFTISADTGYHIADVVIDGSTHLGAVSSYQFTDVQASHSIAATFAVNSYTLTIVESPSPAGGSYVDPYEGTMSYPYGTVVTITAHANPGWTFTGWSGDLSGSANPATITITGNMAVTANFAQNNYTVSVTIVPMGGSVYWTPYQTLYHYGDIVQFEAVNNTGWYFGGWSGDLTGTTNPVSIAITKNMSVTCTFVLNPALTVNIVGSGSVTKNPNLATYQIGAAVQLTAVPAAGWSFAGWSGDLAGTTNPADLIIDTDPQVTATFTQNEYTLDLTVNPVGGGTVRRNATGPYHYGDSVELTAAPAAGWIFQGWSGDVTASGSPVSIVINGPKTVTATFTAYVPQTWSQLHGGTYNDFAYSVVATGDGYVFTGAITPQTGGDYDLWLVKTDLAGKMLWNRTYGNSSVSLEDVGRSVIKTSDGGFAIAGWTYSYGDAGGGADFWLIKTDQNGIKQWDQTYDHYIGVHTNENAYSVVQTADGGYALAGIGGGGFWLVKTDASGTAQWNKTYVPSGGGHEAYSVVQTADGGYALAGWRGGGGTTNNFWLVKTDSSGIAQWNQTYDSGGNDIAYAMVQTSDGGFALAGTNGRIWVVKTDSSGNVQWNSTYLGFSSSDSARSIIQTSDGGYALAGHTLTPTSDLLVKTDSNGNVQWSKIFDTNIGWGWDVSYSVLQASDGTYVVAGYEYVSSGGDQAWLANTGPENCSLTMNTVGQGTVTPGNGTYPVGAKVPMTAIAAPGWTFAGWSGGASGTTNTTLLMDGNKVVTATFTQIEYSLGIGIWGNGLVQKSPDKTTYHYGDTVTLTAVPVFGWTFANWTVWAGFDNPYFGTGNPVTVIINGTTFGSFNFTQNEYVLTIYTVGKGVVSHPNGTYHEDNRVITLQAYPESGWTFAGWSGDFSSTDNPVSPVIINASTSVTATFIPIEYTLNINVIGSGSVTKNPNQATYHYGYFVQLTANPAAGWSFSGWSGDASGSDNPIYVGMFENKSVTATFTQNLYSLTLYTVGSGSAIQGNGTWYHYGDVVAMYATANVGWSFSGWSGDLSGSLNPTTLTITRNVAVTATFTQNEYVVIATWTPTPGGIVTKTPFQSTYHLHDVVTLTATANPGYTFVGWGGDLSGYTANPINVAVNGTTFAIANFVLSSQIGITVKNYIEDIPPDTVWSYLIVDLNTNTIVESFTLPASGGTLAFPSLGVTGGDYSVTEITKFGYTTSMEVNGIEYPTSTVNVHPLPGDFFNVTFINSAMPAFATQYIDQTPPSDLNVQLPALKPVPVQSAWAVDISGNSIVDLVLGKPMAVLVNLAGVALQPNDQVTVSVTFEGTAYSKTFSAVDLGIGAIVGFSPIVPSSTGTKDITGNYKINSGNPVALTPTSVTVKTTNNLSLYFAYLTKSSYGSVDQASFDLMAQNSVAFLNATYPIKNATVNIVYSGKSIAGSTKSGTSGMQADCVAVAAKAKSVMGTGAVGVAIGPNNTGLSNYFATFGKNGAAGISFGTSTKGVVVLDGYYTAAAHEVAHTYGLYWGKPEQYQTDPPNGKASSGVWPANGQWRTGYSFMGTAPYRTLDFSWVDDGSTYRYLFNHTATKVADPEIVVVSGLIYKTGEVEILPDVPWYHFNQGTADIVPPGDYAIKFVDANGNTLNITSFAADFFMHIDPGTGVGEDQVDTSGYGMIPLDTASFVFAAEYPSGTAKIQVIDVTKPQIPLAEKTAQELVQVGNTVTFTQSGLPAGTPWSITLEGFTKSSTTNTITFTGVSSGSYTWSAMAQISGGTGIRYVTSLSSGTMNVPTQASQNVAYTAEYKLTVTSAYGTVGGDIWYASGAYARATVTPLIIETAGTRYVFTGWSGDASGNTSPSNSIKMNSPKTAIANWKTQYQVSFCVSPLNAGTVSPSKTAYYDKGSKVSISATSSGGDDCDHGYSGYSFWTGDDCGDGGHGGDHNGDYGNSAYTFWNWTSSNPSITFAKSTSASTTATINGPGTITANFAYSVSDNENVELTGSNNVIIINGGNHVIDCRQATSTTVLKVGRGNNVIYLGGGDNIVKETAGGNDKITTGNGDNDINIDANGNYQITTGDGDDKIQITGDGNSVIKAGDGNNIVTISGDGNNQITTGKGKDVVVAGDGNNNIQTGAGDDKITVGKGNSVIDGGAGYDVCVHGKGHNTILNCEIK